MKRLCSVVLSVFAMGLVACGDSSPSSSDGNGSAGGTSKCSVTVNACPETLPEGSVCDARDGLVYKTVTIGTQTWTAQNANYCTGTNWCYDNKAANCEKYGRLYTWKSAKSACPDGFHLPVKEEWNALDDYVTAETGNLNYSLRGAETWTHEMSTPGGDKFGFNALAGGHYEKAWGFNDIGFKAYFWSNDIDPTSNSQHPTALISFLSGFGTVMGVGNSFTDSGLSVRCVKD
ncbi:FISUMP domain-containing protein [Fibrobacter sp. UWEL]|uniref:FISUMP domain-containing protein n=1 Tax=Fibrobacter sp. UWEL TaxID=1896209 RepID=UPI000919ED7F|nr:FISUMP domain-containing protein [Fibrobacter sp. UWEL]SHK30049.1 major paralogous domain-containing protein [Fibrobacter sp. UWEL]